MLSKYIKWGEILAEEICLECLKDSLEDSEFIKKDILDDFLRESELELMVDECYFTDDLELVFCFAESGGITEGDSQGWSREYYLVFDTNFELIDISYEQG
jgi:hypothetical protein